jgi:hypothetical protein
MPSVRRAITNLGNRAMPFPLCPLGYEPNGRPKHHASSRLIARFQTSLSGVGRSESRL